MALIKINSAYNKTMNKKMASSTSLTAETLRIKNRSTGRAMWLVVDDSGTLQTSEVSLDVNYAPDFLTAPIAEATPAQESGSAFVIGRAYALTFIFDGNLGVGSTVGLQNPTGGVVTGISVSGSHVNFTYTSAALDVLKFTVVAPNLNRTARRLFKPFLVNLGPSYVTNTLGPLSFVDGWCRVWSQRTLTDR